MFIANNVIKIYILSFLFTDPFIQTSRVLYATCYFNNTYTPVKGRVDIMQDMSRPVCTWPRTPSQ